MTLFLLTLSPSASTSALSGLLPRPADSFVDAIGVNTHFIYTDTPYVTAWNTVKRLLVASGIRHVRDALVADAAYERRLATLGSAGIRFNLGATIDPNAGENAAYITSFPKRVPSMESFEGPNEFDGSKVHWVADMQAYQKMLFNAAAPTNLPVIGSSMLEAQSALSKLGNSLAGSQTYGNVHKYFANNNPGSSGWGANFPPYGVYGSIAYDLNIAKATFGNIPIMVTETGYNDAGTPPLPQPIKLRYTLRALLEFWNAGVSRSYLYEFVDEGVGEKFGLLDRNAQPKTTYTAVKNLIRALRDPGPAFTLTPLACTISGTASLHHTILQKRNGSYVLILWDEVPSWDTTANVPRTVAPQTVTLSLNAAPSAISAATFNDTGNLVAAPIRAMSASTYTLSINDHVTLVTIQSNLARSMARRRNEPFHWDSGHPARRMR